MKIITILLAIWALAEILSGQENVPATFADPISGKWPGIIVGDLTDP